MEAFLESQIKTILTEDWLTEEEKGVLSRQYILDKQTIFDLLQQSMVYLIISTDISRQNDYAYLVDYLDQFIPPREELHEQNNKPPTPPPKPSLELSHQTSVPPLPPKSYSITEIQTTTRVVQNPSSGAPPVPPRNPFLHPTVHSSLYSSGSSNQVISYSVSNFHSSQRFSNQLLSTTRMVFKSFKSSFSSILVLSSSHS